MVLCPPSPISGCWSTGPLDPLSLASLVVRHWPADPPLARLTAYAVGKAESGGNPSACNWSGECSVGIWQIFWGAHPQYDINRLLEPDYNAEAAREISNNGLNWNPWTQYKNGAYRAFLAEAEWALAQVGEPPPLPGPTSLLVEFGLPAAPVPPGQAFELLLRLRNTGPNTAAGAWLNLHPLSGLTILDAAGGGIGDDGIWGIPNLQLEIGDIAVGGMVERRPRLTAAQTGSYSFDLWGGALNAEASARSGTALVAVPIPPPVRVSAAVPIVIGLLVGGLGFLIAGPPGLLKAKKAFL